MSCRVWELPCAVLLETFELASAFQSNFSIPRCVPLAKLVNCSVQLEVSAGWASSISGGSSGSYEQRDARSILGAAARKGQGLCGVWKRLAVSLAVLCLQARGRTCQVWQWPFGMEIGGNQVHQTCACRTESLLGLCH